MQTSAGISEPEGIHNFRELAGYATANGGRIRASLVFRSGALERMTAVDERWLADELGMGTILDLRRPGEAPAGGHGLAERVVAMDMFPEGRSMEDLVAELNGLYGPGPSPDRYLHYLTWGGDRFAEAFTLFADASRYPILVHCTAGKDRTGVLIGLIMDVLGCSQADIAHEYGLSDASIVRLMAFLRATGHELQGSDDEIRDRLATPPERMAGFIDLMRERYGSAEAFFLGQGVAPETIASVREILIG